MTLPAGVETCTVRILAPIDMLGGDAKAYSGTVRSDRALIWAATGEPIWPVPAELPAPVDGVIEFEAPLVDQAGFVNSEGSAVTGWQMYVKLTGTWSGAMRTVGKAFQVTAETDNPVTLDVMLGESLEPGVVAPTYLAQMQALVDDAELITGLTGESEAIAAYLTLQDLPADGTALAVDIAAAAADAADGHTPGSEMAYAEKTSSQTTTTVIATMTNVSGLSCVITGTGRPVEIEVFIPRVYHSVADGGVMVSIYGQKTGSAGATECLTERRGPTTSTTGEGVILKRRKVIPAGEEWTFVAQYSGLVAGTSTINVGPTSPAYISITSR